jgi:hypothetical protein
MATTVYEEKEIQLQDGTDVLLKPLPIVQLRRFMNAWREMQALKGETDAEKEDAALNVYINCTGIALEAFFLAEGKFDKTRGMNKDPLSKEYREYLESVLDMDTIYIIMDTCGGMNLSDPKLIETLAAANLPD